MLKGEICKGCWRGETDERCCKAEIHKRCCRGKLDNLWQSLGQKLGFEDDAKVRSLEDGGALYSNREGRRGKNRGKMKSSVLDMLS